MDTHCGERFIGIVIASKAQCESEWDMNVIYKGTKSSSKSVQGNLLLKATMETI